MNTPEISRVFAEQIASILELIGVAAIAFTVLFALARAVLSIYRRKSWHDIYKKQRLDFSRGILIGLDFLVGADIVHTVAVGLASPSIASLGLVVLIRAFLIFSLEIEITGHLPWRRPEPGENVRPG